MPKYLTEPRGSGKCEVMNAKESGTLKLGSHRGDMLNWRVPYRRASWEQKATFQPIRYLRHMYI